MRFSKLFRYLLFIAALAIAGSRAHSQANVVENSSNPIYVDAEKGSDEIANAALAGKVSTPLKTIQAAVNLARTRNEQKIGTTILVKPGTYRESISIGAGSTAAPLTIQAATAGTTVISGSDVLTGWSNEGNGIYYHPWDYNFGTCAVPSGWPSFGTIGRRTEMIFVNGVSLMQVLSESAMKAGTFFIDEATNQLLVKPPTGVNLSTATVEAATRPQILNITGRSNFVLRGVVLEHARSCPNVTGSVITGGSNILVDNVQIVWNNWGGLLISGSTNVTVENSIASYNGGVGFLGNRDVNALYSYDKSDYNNWRGAEAGFYNWGMGGTKLMYMRSTTVEYLHAYGNHAQGLWFDTDNKNITINTVALSDNTLSSLQIEANEGPILLENSHLCDSGMGVTILNTEKFTLKDNVFYNNSGTDQKYEAELYLQGRTGGHVIYDWQTGEYYDLVTKDTVLTGNTFEDASSGQKLFGTYLTGADWSDFANTLQASDNRWYDPRTASAFTLPNNKTTTFTGWKSALGTDYASSWAAPSTSPVSACNAASD